MRAISIGVYRDARREASGVDCTNNGISAKYDQLLLICDRGFIEVDEQNPPENLVKLVKREFPWCGTVYHIEPVARPDPGNVGWMAGGNFAHTCDSRFSEMTGVYGALSIHDRQETQEQHDMLSR